MFRIAVQCDAGDIQEGGFFCNVSRVGYDPFGLIYQETEMQVTLRRQNMKVRSIQAESFDIRAEGR